MSTCPGKDERERIYYEDGRAMPPDEKEAVYLPFIQTTIEGYPPVVI